MNDTQLKVIDLAWSLVCALIGVALLPPLSGKQGPIICPPGTLKRYRPVHRCLSAGVDEDPSLWRKSTLKAASNATMHPVLSATRYVVFPSQGQAQTLQPCIKSCVLSL
jgi:hypothetical protein